jgi:tRNA-binding EMAP/Myf-like protein
VANLSPRDFGKGLVSNGMILAASVDRAAQSADAPSGPSEKLVLATVDSDAAPGARLK